MDDWSVRKVLLSLLAVLVLSAALSPSDARVFEALLSVLIACLFALLYAVSIFVGGRVPALKPYMTFAESVLWGAAAGVLIYLILGGVLRSEMASAGSCDSGPLKPETASILKNCSFPLLLLAAASFLAAFTVYILLRKNPLITAVAGLAAIPVSYAFIIAVYFTTIMILFTLGGVRM